MVAQCPIRLFEIIGADDQALTLFSFNLAKQMAMASLKFLMLKFTVLPVTTHFMEIVHVELDRDISTCLTKLEKLECLK